MHVPARFASLTSQNNITLEQLVQFEQAAICRCFR